MGRGAEVSARYKAGECGLVDSYYVRRPIGLLAIIGFSEKPR